MDQETAEAQARLYNASVEGRLVATAEEKKVWVVVFHEDGDDNMVFGYWDHPVLGVA